MVFYYTRIFTFFPMDTSSPIMEVQLLMKKDGLELKKIFLIIQNAFKYILKINEWVEYDIKKYKCFSILGI